MMAVLDIITEIIFNISENNENFTVIHSNVHLKNKNPKEKNSLLWQCFCKYY